MAYNFFAMLSRMKYIDRWALMRNSREENLSEHSLEVAALAHALAVITNELTGASLNAERAALIGIYHDMPEIITGDMPTPIKHGNPELRQAYREVEKNAAGKLLGMLPDYMQTSYAYCFEKQKGDEELHRLVKAADKLSALIKCIEEKQAGNREFAAAEESALAALRAMELPAVDRFLEDFLGAYSLNLDELQRS